MSRRRVTQIPNLFEQLALSRSYTSLLLGIVVVTIISFLGVALLKNFKTKDTTVMKQDISAAKTESVPQSKERSMSPKTYTVESGDYLWKISEKYYKSGYNWVDIAKANKLENPGIIYAGNTLVIPDVDSKILAAINTSTNVSQQTNNTEVASSDAKITETSYTVQSGDDLWHIAVRAYGDGYKWVDIAKANTLADPNLIYPDQKLKIPR